MEVDAFDFELPDHLIADRPVRPRDAARLLVVRGAATTDARVSDLARLLRPGDLLVANDTRVLPARLTGRRGAARVEVTLLKPAGSDRCWTALARPAKRLKPGDVVAFGPDFQAEVAARGEGGEVTLRFDRAGPAFRAALDRHGVMPLPPYIAKRRQIDARDAQDYQTVFARHAGAVAAPTAGLHLTRDLLKGLEAAGIDRVGLTLHVGAGTFLPVRVTRTEDHKMHAEWGRLSARTADRVNATRARGGRVVALGTTSLRLLESATDETGRVRPFEGETDIFITPGYRFRAVDLLVTNFHLPRSTLYMLVAAFAGLDRMMAAYAHAIGAGYRFYSYGDACLLYGREP